ncbi:hypothetical protein BG004_003162, partial [Podila humilis]
MKLLSANTGMNIDNTSPADTRNETEPVNQDTDMITSDGAKRAISDPPTATSMDTTENDHGISEKDNESIADATTHQKNTTKEDTDNAPSDARTNKDNNDNTKIADPDNNNLDSDTGHVIAINATTVSNDISTTNTETDSTDKMNASISHKNNNNSNSDSNIMNTDTGDSYPGNNITKSALNIVSGVNEVITTTPLAALIAASLMPAASSPAPASSPIPSQQQQQQPLQEPPSTPPDRTPMGRKRPIIEDSSDEDEAEPELFYDCNNNEDFQNDSNIQDKDPEEKGTSKDDTGSGSGSRSGPRLGQSQGPSPRKIQTKQDHSRMLQQQQQIWTTSKEKNTSLSTNVELGTLAAATATAELSDRSGTFSRSTSGNTGIREGSSSSTGTGTGTGPGTGPKRKRRMTSKQSQKLREELVLDDDVGIGLLPKKRTRNKANTSYRDKLQKLQRTGSKFGETNNFDSSGSDSESGDYDDDGDSDDSIPDVYGNVAGFIESDTDESSMAVLDQIP